MRRLRGILGVLGCCAVGAAGLAGPAQAAGHTYLVTYEGDYIYHEHDTSHNGNSDYTDTLNWTMRAYWDPQAGRVTRSLDAEGVHSSVNTGAFANNNYDCTLKPSGRTANLPITVGLGDAPGTLAVTVTIPAQSGPNGELTSTGTPGHCALTTLLSSTGPDGAWDTGSCASFPASPAFAPEQDVRSARAAGFTKRIHLAQTATVPAGCLPAGSTVSATRSIHAKLIVGAGGPSGPPPPGPPPAQQRRQKVFAQGDLLTTLLRAEVPCGLLALGTTTFVWSSTVGGPTAPAALVPASYLISAGVPLCAAYGMRAYNDILIINDPPAGNVNVIATPVPTPTAAADARKLPSCAGRPAAVRSFCRSLRADLGAEIAAAQRGAAIATALRITVDRETKARLTHRATAFARQLAAGDRLVRALQAATRSERAIGAKISAEIAAQHVTGQLTTQQHATAIAAVLRVLKSHGVSRATVRRLAPAAAGPYNLLAHCASSVDRRRGPAGVTA